MFPALPQKDEMEKFIRLVSTLEQDNKKLKNATDLLESEAYKKATQNKSDLESHMKEAGTGSRITSARRKMFQQFLNFGGELNQDFNKILIPIDKAINDANKYDEELIGEMENLKSIDPKSPSTKDPQKAKQAAFDIKRYQDARDKLENELYQLDNLQKKAENARQIVSKAQLSMNQKIAVFLKKNDFQKSVIPDIRQPPRVTIFEGQYTPMEIKTNHMAAYTFARNVGSSIQLADDDQEYEDLCKGVGQPSLLTAAQKTPYYYSNPNNPVSILLNHTAGSGKTAAMTLAASLYVRAGYLPIIVTTDALANEKTYEEATFLQCADFNIQEIMLANRCKTYAEVVERTIPDPTADDVYSAGKQDYGRMAQNVWQPELKLTFKQFTAVCRKYLANELAKKDSQTWPFQILNTYKTLLSRGPKDPNDENLTNVLSKTVILMDEVQTMMNEPQPNDDGVVNHDELGDIRVVTKALWTARRRAGRDGPVVIAASATPGNTGYEFVMLLNLLCTEEEGYHFEGVDEPTFTQRVYNARDLKEAFDLTNADFKPLAEQMAWGRVSFYDSGGSRSVPAMRPLKCEVRLTKDQSQQQAQEIKNLATVKHIHLVQGDDQSWFIEENYAQRYNRQATNNQLVLANFIQNIKSNSIVARVPLAKTYVDLISKDKSVPKLSPTGDNFGEWRSNARVISPLYFETIELIKKNKNLGVRKHYVYISFNEGGSKTKVGITLFCNMLDSLLRYNDVLDKTRDKYTQPEGVYGKLSIPKRRSGAPLTPVEEARLQDLRKVLSMFNSPANKNGSIIDVIVLDPSYKEGISLAGVGAVYIVGAVESQTDLVQSVARAFRNCRTDPNELTPTNDVPVYLMIPYAPDGETLKILQGVRPDDESATIKDVCKQCAFDKQVLKSENDRAEATQDLLREAMNS